MTSSPRAGFRVLVIVAGLALLTTVGCSQQDPGGQDPGGGGQTSGGQTNGGQTSGGSTSHPAPTQETTGAVVDEEPRTDLTGEHVVEWTEYEVVSDRELRFHFPTGTPDCLGARAVAEEDEAVIRVATIVGTVPEAPKDCPAVGRIASILVTTEAPVAERAVEHLELAEDDLP